MDQACTHMQRCPRAPAKCWGSSHGFCGLGAMMGSPGLVLPKKNILILTYWVKWSCQDVGFILNCFWKGQQSDSVTNCGKLSTNRQTFESCPRYLLWVSRSYSISVYTLHILAEVVAYHRPLTFLSLFLGSYIHTMTLLPHSCCTTLRNFSVILPMFAGEIADSCYRFGPFGYSLSAWIITPINGPRKELIYRFI